MIIVLFVMIILMIVVANRYIYSVDDKPVFEMQISYIFVVH